MCNHRRVSALSRFSLLRSPSPHGAKLLPDSRNVLSTPKPHLDAPDLLNLGNLDLAAFRMAVECHDADPEFIRCFAHGEELHPVITLSHFLLPVKPECDRESPQRESRRFAAGGGKED